MADKHQRSLLDVQPELQEAVVRLLLSLDEANLKIAVSLLNGEPSPPPVRAAFLVVAHLKRLAPRQQLLFKHQLRAHLPDALRPDYDRLFHLDHPSDPYPGPNGLHIGSLIRLLKADPELDGLEVARIMFQGGDARLRACALHYWLLSQEEQKLYYLLAHLRPQDLNYDKKNPKIRHYPRLNEAIDQFMRLDEIQLSGTKQALEKFPALLSDFVFLRRLSLTHHTFSDIPEDLPPLPHLSFLDLSHNHLTSFPKALASFDALSILDLSNQQNNWENFDFSLEQLYRLKTLLLSGNGMTSFPPALLSLPALVKLDLSHNALTDLPTSLAQLSKLQSLDLRGNPLKDSVAGLQELPRLKLLFLDEDQLGEESRQKLQAKGVRIKGFEE
jgi:hypothetical protein